MVGFSSYLMIDPEAGLGVVVLMNGNEERKDLVKYVLEAGRAAAAGQALPEPPPPADPADLGSAAAEYAGVYTAPGGGPAPGRSLTLAAADGRLLLRHEGADVALEREDGDVFLVPHADLDRFPLRFWRDEQGRVTQVTHGADWYVGPAYGGPTAFPPVGDASGAVRPLPLLERLDEPPAHRRAHGQPVADRPLARRAGR